jgi:hypothetical protein
MTAEEKAKYYADLYTAHGFQTGIKFTYGPCADHMAGPKEFDTNKIKEPHDAFLLFFERIIPNAVKWTNK